MDLVSIQLAFHHDIGEAMFPLRRKAEAEAAIIELHEGNRAGTAESSNIVPDKGAEAEHPYFQPGGIIGGGAMDGKIPATDERRFGMLGEWVVSPNSWQRCSGHKKQA